MEGFFYAPHDVEIRQAGLDHHHVRAFGDVERDFPQRLFGIRGIHLIGLFAAFTEIRRGADGVTKRSVERRRILGGIRQNLGVDETFAFKRITNRAHPPIHHVGRRDHIHARARLRQSLLDQHFKRGIVQHIALRINHAILAMRGKRIERDIGDHAEFRHRVFNCFDRTLRQAVRIESLAPVGSL